MAGSVVPISLSYETATAILTVKTDAKTRIYIDDELKGETTGNGVLNISAIVPGNHEIKLIKDGFTEYKETRAFEGRMRARLEHDLVPLPTPSELFDDFDDASLHQVGTPQPC
jgi:hypothetical protein